MSSARQVSPASRNGRPTNSARGTAFVVLDPGVAHVSSVTTLELVT